MSDYLAENSQKNDLAVGGLLPLPKLSAQDLNRATDESSVAWLWGLLGAYRPGDFHSSVGGRATLQKVTLDTFRCVRIYGQDEEALWFLSMLRATCGVAGVTLDLRFTLVTPMTEDEIDSLAGNRTDQPTPEPKQLIEESKMAERDRDEEGYNVGMEVV